MRLSVTTVDSLEAVPQGAWNALQDAGRSPFLEHAFLHGLERCDCVGARHGWQPRHLLVHDAGGRLVGAAPFYVKTHSYGELVFDWAWADAYARHGLDYYPKAVGTIPYTPVSGTRFLVHPRAERGAVRKALAEAAVALARQEGWSGVHFLFLRPDEARFLREAGWFLRQDLQYHWDNPGYRDWEDFLAVLKAKRRKEIRRERRRVEAQGLALRVVHGDEAGAMELDRVHALYAGLFERKFGYPTLSRAFFHHLATALGRRLVLFLAEQDRGIVAMALCLRDERVLYGRLWGVEGRHDCLHFELCYHQGIAYCIRHGLARFEPGAQGEHKIARGFLPATTWSAHWIADPRFAKALARWSAQEQAAVREHWHALMRSSPYREATAP